MFKEIRILTLRIWRWFRSRSFFVQIILVVPVLSAIILTVMVGNMGLALMGTAVALYAPVVGWFGGLFAVTLAKSTAIILRDRKAKSRQ
jgi:hypothetical protein